MNDEERIRIGEHVVIYRRGRRGIWTAEFHRDGKHCRRSLKTSNKKPALQRAIRLEHELTSGTFKPPTPATMISDGKKQYFEYLKTEGRARNTIVRYQGELNCFEVFCRGRGIRQVAQITPSVLDAYRAERQKTHHVKTVYHETVVVKQFVRWCESRHLMAENLLRTYRVSKPISQPKPAPTLGELQRIFAEATPERRLIFAVLAFTGLRVGELQKLRQEDIDLLNAWVRVVSRPGAETKTRQSRQVPIHPVLLKLLGRVRRRNGQFFFSAARSGKYPDGDHQVSPRHLNEGFQSIAERLGMPVGRESGYTLHSLRRFFETFCVNSGAPQRAIDAWMGHSGGKSMAAVYYSLSDIDSQAMIAKIPFSIELPAQGSSISN
jgi:integrase